MKARILRFAVPKSLGLWCRVLGIFISCLPLASFGADASWRSALSGMPLPAGVTQLTRTNCVAVMLAAFQSNSTVKALIFMPGATDEFYMFRRAQAQLTNAEPSLLDAVNALTNETFIRATFYPPLLLLHTDEDPLEPAITIQHPATAEKLKRTTALPHVLYDDRDWSFVQPLLKQSLKIAVGPDRYSYDTWHFYRHSFAAWNLTGWEALETVAFAGKTTFTLRRNRVVFEGDPRFRTIPKLDTFPR